MNDLLTLKNGSKKIGKKIILDDVTMPIAKGDAITIVGANGSGKSTLLRIIAGMTQLSSGTRHVAKKNLKISYVPDRFPKLPLNTKEYLYYMGEIEGLSKEYLDKKIDDYFNDFEISIEIRKNLIKNCSKGTIQKIAIIQAILSKPDLIILDEPFSGLDVNSQDKLSSIINNLIEEQTAVVLTCHERDFIEKINSKIILLEDGKIVLNEDKKILERNHNKIIRFKINKSIDNNILGQINGVYSIKNDNDLYIINVSCDFSDHILTKLLSLGGSICSVNDETI